MFTSCCVLRFSHFQLSVSLTGPSLNTCNFSLVIRAEADPVPPCMLTYRVGLLAQLLLRPARTLGKLFALYVLTAQIGGVLHRRRKDFLWGALFS